MADVLRVDTVGGALVLGAVLIAVVWSNSPWSDAYASIATACVGPASLQLNLSLAQWAADGLLPIFFFVAGLELKREFVVGDLRDPRRAALPIAAALGGMIVPSLLFVTIDIGAAGGGALRGWAIPTATDVVLALAVLAVISTHLPTALRAFLLTLAVVDDLLAITVIAAFYTRSVDLVPLLAATVPLGAFGILVQRRIRSGWLLLPLAVMTWTLVHASGVNTTVAGVLLGFAVPAARSRAEKPGLAKSFEHRWQPLSAGVVVPLFAFFSAGVSITAAGGLASTFTDTVTLGVLTGLVLGKTVGVFGTTFLMHQFTPARLGESVSWWDLFGLALLAGMGFTVSLLIGRLAFGADSDRHAHVTVGVLTASALAAFLATLVLRARNRVYRRLTE
jgi:NhaA family Na+:H+ antiporter